MEGGGEGGATHVVLLKEGTDVALQLGGVAVVAYVEEGREGRREEGKEGRNE